MFPSVRAGALAVAFFGAMAVGLSLLVIQVCARIYLIYVLNFNDFY
jgi:hypothetical protein